jgi:hypothetical protein
MLASGDGGFLMGLADLESLIGAARSPVVVIYNDAAYGAEIHQYGSQGLTEKPRLISEVDFSGVSRALGAESAVIRSLEDLSALQDWIDAGAKGTFVADCRSNSVSGHLRKTIKVGPRVGEPIPRAKPIIPMEILEGGIFGDNGKGVCNLGSPPFVWHKVPCPPALR